jgi:hypothetical protein
MADEIDLEKLLNELFARGIDVEGGTYASVVTILCGLSTRISKDSFKKAVDKVLATYNKNATAISALALGLSIFFLIDSIQDNQRIKRLYMPQIQNALVYPDEKLRLQRLKEIKLSLEAERERQVTMGVIKGIAALAFGFLAFNTIGNSTARYMMGAAAAVSGAAALVNVYNYLEFNTLIKKLKEDHLID